MVGLAGFFWNKEPRRQADHAAADRDRWRAMLAAAPQPWCAWTDQGDSALSDEAAALLGICNADDLTTCLTGPELAPALSRLDGRLESPTPSLRVCFVHGLSIVRPKSDT